MDSGCGLVDRAVASETRDPRFESNHRQILFTINCIIKDKNKENEAGNGPLVVSHFHGPVLHGII